MEWNEMRYSSAFLLVLLLYRQHMRSKLVRSAVALYKDLISLSTMLYIVA